MIDWNKVPQDRKEEVEALDARIKDLETGYLHDYGNTVRNLYLLAETALIHYLEEDEKEMWHDSLDYLAKMYGFVEWDKVPLTKDTAPYSVCKQLYEKNLLPATEEFTAELISRVKPRTAKEVMKQAGIINGVSRLIPKLHLQLRTIPGCEERRTQSIYIPHKLNTHPDYRLE